MTRLNELIQELCPDGVEYKTLGEVCEILDNKRKPVTKSARVSGIYPYYGANGIQDYVSEYIFDGTFVLVGEDGSVITKSGNPIVTWAEGKIWVNNHAHIIQEKNGVLLRFLYHFIQTIDITHLVHGNIPKLTGGDFKSLQIPVPPLAVQEEIVHILDKFMSLTAELTAELTARRAQYEYYRDALLTPPFPFGYAQGTPLGYAQGTVGERSRTTVCEYKKLGEIATITRGGNFQKKDFVESGFPCIHYGQMYTHFGTWADKTLTFVSKEVFDKSKKAQPGDIVMAVTSENVEDVCKCTAWLGDVPIAVSGHTAIIHHNQNSKYLSYYFHSSLFYNQKVKLAHGTKVIEVTPDKLNDITIPLPPLPAQQRIVSVLDNFDAICADLKIGLPAEIEARKKQYEYYRDLLLTFAERGNTILTADSRQQTADSRQQTADSRQQTADEIKLLQYVFGYAVVRLGDVAKINRGIRVTRDILSEDDKIPVYQNALTPLGYFNKSNRKGYTTFVISAGAAGKVGFSNVDFWAADDCYTFDDLQELNSKFIYYFLQSKQTFIDSHVRKASIPRISRSVFENITIPLPPLSVQDRIVQILDRFESLVVSTASTGGCRATPRYSATETGGIPAEIEARKKQYEYYRDLLLNFKKC